MLNYTETEIAQRLHHSLTQVEGYIKDFLRVCVAHRFGFENMGVVADVLIQRFPSLPLRPSGHGSGQALAIIEEYAPLQKRLRPYQTLVLAVDEPVLASGQGTRSSAMASEWRPVGWCR